MKCSNAVFSSPAHNRKRQPSAKALPSPQAMESYHHPKLWSLTITPSYGALPSAKAMEPYHHPKLWSLTISQSYGPLSSAKAMDLSQSYGALPSAKAMEPCVLSSLALSRMSSVTSTVWSPISCESSSISSGVMVPSMPSSGVKLHGPREREDRLELCSLK